MINRILIAASCLLGLLALVPQPMTTARASIGPLLIVVGKHFPVDDIRLADLKSAFRGRPTYVAGARLIPLNHPTGSPTRVAFDRSVLGLQPEAVGRFWIDRRIRDEGAPPKTVPTPELAVRVVAALRGMVTYAAAPHLSPKVKVLTVDGLAAEHPSYPLRQ